MLKRLAQGAVILALLALPVGFLLIVLQEHPDAPKVLGKTRLNASGATFIYPMTAKWASEYHKVNAAEVAYASKGSTAGKADLLAKTVDFCCSDFPLSEEEIAKFRSSGGDVIHVPLAMGAVAPVYNLGEIKDKQIRFTGELLADIYLGKIKKWNDPQLQVIQEEGIVLPDQDIAAVHRRDSSGSTYLWTEYLAKSSAEWKGKVGIGSTVQWPTGIGAIPSEGIGAFVKQTPGAIGYMEMIYALQNRIQIGVIKNRDGNFVMASQKSVIAAAENSVKSIPDDLRYSLIDASGQDSYPIVGTNWAVVYVDPPAGNGKAIYDFLWWVTHDGQEMCEALHYGHLPPELIPCVERQLAKIKK